MGKKGLFLYLSRPLLIKVVALFGLLAFTLSAYFIVIKFKEPSVPIIFIDAGHGGIDSGARYNNINEKDLNLKIALALGEELQKRGYEIIYSRTEDIDMCTLFGLPYSERQDLQVRVEQVEQSKADLLISIHCNATSNSHERGPMTFYHHSSKESKELAYHLQRHMNYVALNSTPAITYTYQPRSANFYLLRNTSVPAVLVEAGFMSNPEDLKLLLDPLYQQEIVQVLAQGTEEFLQGLSLYDLDFFADPVIRSSEASPEDDTIAVEAEDLYNSLLQWQQISEFFPEDLILQSLTIRGTHVELSFNKALERFLADDPTAFRMSMSALSDRLSTWSFTTFSIRCEGKVLSEQVDRQLEWDQTIPVTSKQAKMAIVIDDLGNRAVGTEELLQINRPITLAIMPFMEHSTEESEKAHRSGFPVIIHLSLEANRASPNWYGPSTIKTSMSDEEIISIVEQAHSSVPHAIGFNNHMGSKATADERVARLLVEKAKKLNWLIVDSRTSEDSKLIEEAKRLDVPYGSRDYFIDVAHSKEGTKKRILEAAKTAMKTGKVLIIGHVGPDGGKSTVQALREVLPELEAKNVEIVSVTDIAQQIQVEERKKASSSTQSL
ncbi:divergent polysaccharide deacetylase family protein [Heliorestis convoluta]|uniref:Divergent polysaccharide deacetylase protein n=1 Tax=Heliorestis convoluta TaxID=356322 RepID=A0A5Q2N8T0_9FIRM|nr:divergent polysaccharide deacetylase family protein [Heliorestis convoluta]QGG48660.1 Divergent polysaccharide deacetylase protein [Heliorestis convoluta]